MRVLVAFDKFKDCMRATEACALAAEVIAQEQPEWEVQQAPLTDGGEGFAEILTTLADGQLLPKQVRGPRGEPVNAHYGVASLADITPAARKLLNFEAEGRIAIIEMAQASGLELLPAAQRDLWQTDTFGTGELMLDAAQQQVSGILLGLGGSATNDMGLGALSALGFYDQIAGPAPLRECPANWEKGGHHFRSACATASIRIACDVNNPLLGPNGAAAVYGPQKGLKAPDLTRMQSAMKTMADTMAAAFDRDPALMDEPGAGAAGGIGFGLRVAYGQQAQYVPGFDLVWRWLGLEEKLAWADLIITGEGRFDLSSLQGKGPGTLIEAAQKQKKQFLVLGGAIAEAPEIEALAGNVQAITPQGIPLAEALAKGKDYLQDKLRACLHECKVR